MTFKPRSATTAVAFIITLLIFTQSLKVGDTAINTVPTPITALDQSEQQIIALINATNLYGYDQYLENIALTNPDFRSAGSTGANATANWVKTQFESFGLNETKLEPFQFMGWSLSSEPSLIIDMDGNQTTTDDQQPIVSFECEHYSWPTPDEGTFGDLATLPLPVASDHTQIGMNPIDLAEWDLIDTTGKIVLIGREIRWSGAWQSTFINKLSAQPPAAVVYTWWYDWMNFTPMLYSSTGGRPTGGPGGYYWNLRIPTGSINYENGLSIRQSEETQNVSARVTIRSIIKNDATHFNVVGEISGNTNPDKKIIISAHYDTVVCNGFCDNGAGSAAVIELARVFSTAVARGFYSPSFTLLFITFTAEELDLVGSVNYIAQHKDEMSNMFAVINLDCIGNMDLYVTQTNPTPTMDLDEVIVTAASDLNLSASIEGLGGSDQESFRNPSYANNIVQADWNINENISDATPVESSAMIISRPLQYSDEWSLGKPGWIHTSYDNSTSTSTLDWIGPQNLANHTAVAALTAIRVSINLIPEFPLAEIVPLLTISFLIYIASRSKFRSRRSLAVNRSA